MPSWHWHFVFAGGRMRTTILEEKLNFIVSQGRLWITINSTVLKDVNDKLCQIRCRAVMLMNTWRSRSKHILQWRYYTAMKYQFIHSFVHHLECTVQNVNTNSKVHACSNGAKVGKVSRDRTNHLDIWTSTCSDVLSHMLGYSSWNKSIRSIFMWPSYAMDQSHYWIQETEEAANETKVVHTKHYYSNPTDLTMHQSKHQKLRTNRWTRMHNMDTMKHLHIRFITLYYNLLKTFIIQINYGYTHFESFHFANFKNSLGVGVVHIDFVQFGFIVECHHFDVMLGCEFDVRRLLTRIGINDTAGWHFQIYDFLDFTLWNINKLTSINYRSVETTIWRDSQEELYSYFCASILIE